MYIKDLSPWIDYFNDEYSANKACCKCGDGELEDGSTSVLQTACMATISVHGHRTVERLTSAQQIDVLKSNKMYLRSS